MKSTCLGIFDSGVGGFTVLKRVLERHSEIECLYLGDTARVPYGEKNSDEIREIAKEVAIWLNKENVSAILVACNTTNSLALDVIEDISCVPVFGLIEGLAKMITQTRVGVLATTATIKSSAYRRQIQKCRPGALVFQQACPAFVPLIESGDLETDNIYSYARDYLKPLIEANVEAIVLGCSHFPLLIPVLKRILPNNVRLIDPAIGLASNLDQFLGPPRFSLSKSLRPEIFKKTRFCVTSEPSDFLVKTQFCLGCCPNVELISLRSKALSF